MTEETDSTSSTDPLDDPVVFGRILARRMGEGELDSLVEQYGSEAELVIAGAKFQEMWPLGDGSPNADTFSFFAAMESFMEYWRQMKHERDNPNW